MPTRRRWKRPRPNSPPPASSRLRCARAEGAAGSGRAGRACLRKGRKQRKGERQEHPSLGVRFRLRFRRLSRRGVCIGSKRKLSPARSEEHTSELQSIMRLSYAVFCLKKKNRHFKDNKT